MGRGQSEQVELEQTASAERPKSRSIQDIVRHRQEMLAEVDRQRERDAICRQLVIGFLPNRFMALQKRDSDEWIVAEGAPGTTIKQVEEGLSEWQAREIAHGRNLQAGIPIYLEPVEERVAEVRRLADEVSLQTVAAFFERLSMVQAWGDETALLPEKLPYWSVAVSPVGQVSVERWSAENGGRRFVARSGGGLTVDQAWRYAYALNSFDESIVRRLERLAS